MVLAALVARWDGALGEANLTVTGNVLDALAGFFAVLGVVRVVVVGVSVVRVSVLRVSVLVSVSVFG